VPITTEHTEYTEQKLGNFSVGLADLGG